jgi:cobalt-zinc-cadmium efflux system outer membrane protein
LTLVLDEMQAELDPALTVSSALRTGYQTRPDLRAADERVIQSDASVRLAAREAIPNPVISAIADRAGQGESARFGVSLGIPLPFFDRRQGDRHRAAAEARAADLDREALRQRLEQQVREAFTVVHSAREEVEILTDEVLLPARENHGLLEIAYREGKMDLSTLLLLRNQLLDAQMSYWDAWQRWREAEAEIRFATGTSVYYYELPQELVR